MKEINRDVSQTILMGISPKQFYGLFTGKHPAIAKKMMPKKTEPPYEIYLYINSSKRKDETLYADLRVEDNPILFGNPYIPTTDEVEAGLEVLCSKVIAKCKCSRFETMRCSASGREQYSKDVGMTPNQLLDMCGNKDMGVWYISDLELLLPWRTLKDFGMEKPPQNWCYLLNGERR